MAEVRDMREGSLRWVYASGSGTSWATASAPGSGLFGYVDSFSVTSAQTIQTQMDRGTPTHHKVIDKQPPQLTLNFRWTGYMPSAVSGSGASVPMMHLEWRSEEPENGGSGRYYQFYGVPIQQAQITENAQGNTVALTLPCLGMSGANNTGYLG